MARIKVPLRVLRLLISATLEVHLRGERGKQGLSKLRGGSGAAAVRSFPGHVPGAAGEAYSRISFEFRSSHTPVGETDSREPSGKQ